MADAQRDIPATDTGIRGEVVSLSVSMPELVRMGEMEWSTSIMKKPGTGPIEFTMDGPVGNKPAVHPETVYSIGVEAYDYWAERLGVDRSEWEWGRWGENITFCGLLEKDIRVGDILEIGDQTVLQVSGARNPCVKLSWRLGQPASLLATLVQSGVTGFYLRVLTPGWIKAGDEVRVKRPYPENMAIIDIPRLIHDIDAKSDTVRSALDMPALGDYSKMFLRQRLSQALDNEITSKNRWEGWRDFQISAIGKESADVRSFTLTPVDGLPIAGYRPGQFLTFRIPDGDRFVQRQWSISDYSEDGGSYRISVKRVEDGKASRWLHDQAQMGTVLPVKAPAGRFVLDLGSHKPIIFISAGIGITPLLAMLKAHRTRKGGQVPPVVWIHGTRSGDHDLFRGEVADLIGGTEIQRHIFYSRPQPPDQIGVDYDHEGRPTIDVIKRLVDKVVVNLAGKIIEIPGQVCDFYICGPADMQQSLREGLIAWGAEDHAVQYETFSPPAKRDAPTAEQAEVFFSTSGQTAIWRAEDDMTLLELAESAGINPSSNCRMGTCHSCICRVSVGKVEHLVEVHDVDERHALLCSAVPLSDRIVLAI